MPQVLLINPPNSSSVLDGADPTVTRSEDLTDWANVPSLGVLTLASAIEDIPGVTPVYLDGTVVPWPDILSYIEENAGDLLAVGVSMLTANYEAALALLQTVKRIRPQVRTIAGNDHFTALAGLCLENQPGCIDFGFVGNEVIGPFRALIGDLAAGTLRPRRLPGPGHADRGRPGADPAAARADLHRPAPVPHRRGVPAQPALPGELPQPGGPAAHRAARG
jgi:hypothetical protein